MRYVLTGVVMALASGVLAGTNLPARVANNTNAPAAARKPMFLAQPVAGDLAVVARMAPAGAVTGHGGVSELAPNKAVARDGAVVALGGAVKAEGTASVPGLGTAVAGTNGLVVAGLSPAGYVMAAQVREIHSQQAVEDDAAFLGDVDVWRGGPLGEIVTQAMQVKRRGDQEAYEGFLARYWVEYGMAMERRRGLGKTGTQRPVTGR